jgi:CHASE3 domain sensor protein
MTWIATVAKLAPHVIKLGELAISALPHFTQSKSEGPLVLEDRRMAQQIAELQVAATDNADAIRKIAGDLQAALSALEQAAEAVDARFRRLERMLYLAVALAIVLGAIGIALSLR